METKSLLGIFLFLVLASEPSLGISRSTVTSNAASWLNPPVSYSQSATKDGYRKDCSGYVSMAWELPSSRTTRTLGDISTAINKNDLESGDILLKSGSHVTIFGSWVDSTKTRYWGYEQVGGKIQQTKYWRIPYPYWGNDAGYQPRRYNQITDY